MYRFLKIKLLLLMSISLLSCENPLEDRVNKLEDELENQKIGQENQNKLIETLILQLAKQQTIIDSLNKKNEEYSDSLFNNLHNYTDSVSLENIRILDSINTSLTNYISNLIIDQNNIIQALIDSQPETGNDYLRIDSIQICWGSVKVDKSGKEIFFPKTFIEVPSIVMTPSYPPNFIYGFSVVSVNEIKATFTITSDILIDCRYIAIGKWK